MAARRIAFAAAASVALASSPALAWQEAHQVADDAEIRLGASGAADVEQQLRWHVVRGPFKGFDLLNVDAAAILDPAVAILGEDGKAYSAHVARREDRVVRVTVDEPRSLMRGDFTFAVRWRQDLAASHALTREGGSWRLTWSSPVAADGFDGARTVFDVPTATEPPVAIVADTGLVDDTAVASLRRVPGTDVLDLVRPHVGRGEAPVWTLRLDPRAIGAGPVAPSTAAQGAAPEPREPDRIRLASLACVLGGLGLAFGLLVHRRARAFGAACRARGHASASLVPLPDGARSGLAGAALAASVGLEAAGHATAGAVAAAAAALLATLLPAAGRSPARGPGRWLLLSEHDAFGRRPRLTLRSLALGALGLGALLAAAVVARRLHPDGPWLLALDAVALVPLLVTGVSSQLPPDAARSAAWLRPVWRRMRSAAGLRVRPWARVPVEAAVPDELRLLVLPRASIPGLVGVELGLGWARTPVGWARAPEVLARVLEGSDADLKLGRALPAAPRVPGRRAEERVVRLRPRAPTARAAEALLREVALSLTDRRLELRAVRPAGAEDRRGHPAVAAVAVG